MPKRPKSLDDTPKPKQKQKLATKTPLETSEMPHTTFSDKSNPNVPVITKTSHKSSQSDSEPVAVKRPRWSETTAQFLIDQMIEGSTVEKACREHPTKLPSSAACYRNILKSDTLSDEFNTAFTIMLHQKSDELLWLGEATPTELYPHLDWREADAIVKKRMDALKFVIGKLGPILSKKFDKASKVEVSGQALGPQIVVMHWGDPTIANLEKEVQQVTPSLPDVT